MLGEPDLQSQCQIKKKIKIICPYCQQIIEIPMHQAVNGEMIDCPICKQQFVFRKERIAKL